MRKIKGPLKCIFDNINMEKDDLEVVIQIRMRQIHNIINDYSMHPMQKLIELKEHYTVLNWFKSQLKDLKEKEKIISSA